MTEKLCDIVMAAWCVTVCLPLMAWLVFYDCVRGQRPFRGWGTPFLYWEDGNYESERYW